MRRLELDPKDAIPLWKQIEDQVRLQVASGSLGSGDPIPSVRELARELVINPATASKAYRRLTEAGLLEVKRGQGTFVALEPPQLDSPRREQELERAALRYAALARSLGADRKRAEAALRSAWNGSTQSTEGPSGMARRKKRAQS